MQDLERNRSIRRALEKSGLRCFVCFSPDDVLLLSGYWPVMGSSLAIFQADGAVTVLLPEDEIEIAKATSDAELIGYKPSSLQSLGTPGEALIEPLKSLSMRLGVGHGTVGTALADSSQANPYPSTHHFHHIIKELVAQVCPGARIEAADKILHGLRAVKTSTEIALVRRAADLARTGFGAASTAIIAGRREDEVAAEIEAAFARVVNDGFQRGLGSFFCMSGANSTKASAAYARTRTRVLRDGDLVMIHANTAGDGYWTDISRTYVVGVPNDQQQQMAAAIVEAKAAVLDALRPGVAASELDAAARGVLTSYGFGEAFRHSTGHGVGFAAADPNALPRLHPVSTDVLEEGMIFNVEPGIYIEGVGGMRHCDVVLCTASGGDVLTEF